MTDIISLIISIVPSVILVIGWVYSRKTEELKIISNQLSVKKYEVYENITSMFYDILKDMHKKQETDPNSLFENMIEFKKGITLYGSDNVFQAFNTYLMVSSSEDKDKIKILDSFFLLVIAIREDLCGKKTKITKEDVMLNILQDKIEMAKFLNNDI
jgi:hypothetical protein